MIVEMCIAVSVETLKLLVFMMYCSESFMSTSVLMSDQVFYNLSPPLLFRSLLQALLVLVSSER